ncbi:hypothetical protein RA180_21910 [Aeromonas salmonicida]|uniref:hypothetical protein n=1 Tax=Aeromonas salmonicida TaxID=645 RepID=UPI00279678D0|nr:hypothetical protein [Aeromonas salmonicida]MDQ1886649.1 hypothetical protein [Aeromonas salmonicida]
MKAGVMHYGLWLVVLLGLPVQAASIDVTGEYKPATYEVEFGKFINTTPCSVAEEMTGDFWCKGTASLDKEQAVVIKTTIHRTVKNNNNLRDAITYQQFTGKKSVELVNEHGDRKTLSFILTNIGGSHNNNILEAASSTGKQWLYSVSGDCKFRLGSWASSYWLEYFFDINKANQMTGGICYNNDFKKGFVSAETYMRRFYIGYRLVPPDPLKMQNGTYKGSLTLTVGANQDLDFGNGNYSDSTLIVNFSLKVQHQMKVEFPAGSDKVVLQPPGGWHDWIYRGKSHQPPYLIAELPFRLWNSSDFHVWLDCQYAYGEVCMLNNERLGMQVRLEVIYVNKSKEEIPLKHGVKKLFLASIRGPYNINDARSIIFKVQKPALTLMMEHPGSTYKGNVTLIYDAAI